MSADAAMKSAPRLTACVFAGNGPISQIMSVAHRSRIYLLRHARAGWAEPGARDFDRTLDAKGREDAEALGRAMARDGYRPDRVICSAARRCVETWERVALTLTVPDVVFTETLYANDHAAYLDAIRAAAGHGSVMLVGHNPMMEDTAAALLPEAHGKEADTLRRGFPTSGLAVLDLDGSLAGAATARATIAAFLRPE